MRSNPNCLVAGCETRVRTKGMCNKHYERLRCQGTTALAHQREKISGQTSRDMVLVNCRLCAISWMKRRSSLSIWDGTCKSCASKELAKRPEIKAIMRATGIKVMARLGKLPTAPPENRRYGPANNKWRGGITPVLQRIRLSPEAIAWRKAVFKRDDFTCQGCRARGVFLNADHILPFSLHPELRWEIENGRTLCRPCHKIYGAKVFHGRLVRGASFPALIDLDG